MKILLDECLPRLLKRELPGHEVYTVAEMGWAGVKNGALLHLAEAVFEVFLTVDQNLTYQQDLRSRPMAVIVLIARDTRLSSLRTLCPTVVAVLATLAPGSIIRIGPQPGAIQLQKDLSPPATPA